jgi:DNA-binding transcriptional ArsR family regulator
VFNADDSLRERGLALTQRLHRQALSEAGRALHAARRLADDHSARIAQLVPGALAAGLSASEIAERTGLSRQRIYELRDSAPPRQSAEQRIMALLAAEGGLTLPGIARRLDEREAAVSAHVKGLASAGLVHEILTSFEDATPVGYYGLTPDGEAALEEQFWNGLRGGTETRFSVYAPLEPADVEAVLPHAQTVFGDEGFAVLPPGTVRGQARPELAFRVVAETPDDALSRGRERVAELLSLARRGDRPAVISAIAPADPVRRR